MQIIQIQIQITYSFAGIYIKKEVAGISTSQIRILLNATFIC